MFCLCGIFLEFNIYICYHVQISIGLCYMRLINFIRNSNIAPRTDENLLKCMNNLKEHLTFAINRLVTCSRIKLYILLLEISHIKMTRQLFGFTYSNKLVQTLLHFIISVMFAKEHIIVYCLFIKNPMNSHLFLIRASDFA